MQKNEIPVKDINDLLDVIYEKLPKVFKAIRESIFSAQAGTDIGTAIGNFYKALLEKGVPEDKAMELTSEYLRTLTNLSENIKYKKE